VVVFVPSAPWTVAMSTTGRTSCTPRAETCFFGSASAITSAQASSTEMTGPYCGSLSSTPAGTP